MPADQELKNAIRYVFGIAIGITVFWFTATHVMPNLTAWLKPEDPTSYMYKAFTTYEKTSRVGFDFFTKPFTTEGGLGSSALMLASGVVVTPAIDYGVKAGVYGLKKGIEYVDPDIAEYIPQDSMPVFGSLPGRLLYSLYNWVVGNPKPQDPRMSDPVELLRELLTTPHGRMKLAQASPQDLQNFFKQSGILDAMKTSRGQALLQEAEVQQFFATAGGQVVAALLEPDTQPNKHDSNHPDHEPPAHDPDCKDPDCEHPDHKQTDTDSDADPKKSHWGWWLALGLPVAAVIGVVVWVYDCRKSDSFDDEEDCSP